MIRNNSKKGLIWFFLLLIPILTITGCGYRMVGSHNSETPLNGSTLWVDFIVNTSSSSSAQTVMRRALYDEFYSLRSCKPASSRQTAEIIISGTLRSYNTKAISYTAVDLIREYRLTVEVELEVKRPKDSKLLWKGVLTSTSDFPASNPIKPELALQKNAEDAALVAASHKMAQDLIYSMEESY